jgi:murein L,D-transpeptidase YafK
VYRSVFAFKGLGTAGAARWWVLISIWLLALVGGPIISPASALVVELDDVAPDRIERQRAFERGTLPAANADATPLRERLAAKGLVEGAPVLIRIFKVESELELWMRKGDTYVLAATYPICHWTGSLGPKLREGDKQSPEGFYTIGRQQMRHLGRWRQAFNLGYPNLHDKTLQRTGSYVLVHGGCSSTGCYAMTQAQQREIHALASASLGRGQARFQVHIFPFRMTDDNMKKHAAHRWAGFWRDLKAGYDAFEETRRPPTLHVCGQRYAVLPTTARTRTDGPLTRINAQKAAAAGLDPEICRIDTARPEAPEQIAVLSGQAESPAAGARGSRTVYRVERRESVEEPEAEEPPPGWRRVSSPEPASSSRKTKRDTRDEARARIAKKRQAHRDALAEGYRRDRAGDAAQRLAP